MIIPSYPTVYALGHSALADLFLDSVIVEEKIDGSQFSFGRFDIDGFKCRSKSKDQTPPITDKMFVLAAEYVKTLPLHVGWVYRGEVLNSPHHNALSYSRVPVGNVIIFDIDTGDQEYLDPLAKYQECDRLGLECVPVFHNGMLFLDSMGGGGMPWLDTLLENESILGGPKVEGVVIKNYYRWGRDKKAIMGKFVSEKYKEVHAARWGEANPKGGDIIQGIINMYKTEARWEKAVQHLRDNGELQHAPQDIGPLIVEVRADVEKEEEERIKEILYRWAWPKVERAIIAGLPEWYKRKLAEEGFDANRQP